MNPSGVIGSWSRDPSNWKFPNHDAPAEPETTAATDGPIDNPNVPGRMPPDQLVPHIKSMLGVRSADAPRSEGRHYRAIVHLAEHIAHIESTIANQQSRKGK